MTASANAVDRTGDASIVSLPGADPRCALPEARKANAHAWCSRRVFRGNEHQVGEVRAWVAMLTDPCHGRDDAVSVAAELAINAIQHTASGKGGFFIVEISWRPHAIRIAVTDGGSPLEPRVLEDPDAEHGRGLLLVKDLSWRMGVTGGTAGRVIWAEVPRDGRDPVQHARDLLARTVDLAPSVPRQQLLSVLSEYRVALHALAIGRVSTL